jgi:hypothetical protein
MNKPLALSLFDLGVPDPLTPDPVHRTDHLQHGLYMLERHFGFTLQDIAILFRHHRPAAIGYIAEIGAVLNPDDSTRLVPLAIVDLRRLLREAKDAAKGEAV